MTPNVETARATLQLHPADRTQLTDGGQPPDLLHDIESQCRTISQNVPKNARFGIPKSLLCKAPGDFSTLYIRRIKLLFL